MISQRSDHYDLHNDLRNTSQGYSVNKAGSATCNTAPDALEYPTSLQYSRLFRCSLLFAQAVFSEYLHHKLPTRQLGAELCCDVSLPIAACSVHIKWTENFTVTGSNHEPELRRNSYTRNSFSAWLGTMSLPSPRRM